MPKGIEVRMWDLTGEQRDVLLRLAQQWDSFYEDSTLRNQEPSGSET